jgi:hypothetical protein
MSRPNDVTEEDIARWDAAIDKDEAVPNQIKSSSFYRELLRAGMWLKESLQHLGCTEDLIARILFTAGTYSFGRDFWEAHLEILNAYKNNELIFEKDFDELN